MIVGYTTGVFDLFHIGHVRILRNAKAMCDRLIVAVSTDDLVWEYKQKKPVIPFDERLEIVSSMECVDVAVAQTDMDKLEAWKRYKFNIMFVGDDWKGSPKWAQLDEEFTKRSVRIVYFPYTRNTSSTLINETLERLRSVRD